jgi:hypothetical protein
VSLSKSLAWQALQRYTPLVSVSVYAPMNARSVPALRSTAYSSGVSSARHSSSVFCTLYMVFTVLIRRSGSSGLLWTSRLGWSSSVDTDQNVNRATDGSWSLS